MPLALPTGRAPAAVAQAVRTRRGGWCGRGRRRGMAGDRRPARLRALGMGRSDHRGAVRWLLLGACLNGTRDNPLSELRGGLWAMSAGSSAEPPREADLATLRQAVARIRGTGRFAEQGPGVYGLEAMDLWIRQMEEVPGFCGPCQGREKRGWSDALDNGVAMRERALVAAAYLRRLAPSLSPAARGEPGVGGEALRSHGGPAEAHGDGRGGREVRAVRGDLAKQKAHSQAVLRPIREELGAVGRATWTRRSRGRCRRRCCCADVPAGKGDGHSPRPRPRSAPGARAGRRPTTTH